MNIRAALLACTIVAVAACTVTVVPPPQGPAPQPAPVVVQQAPPPAPPVQQAPPPPPVVAMPDPPTRVGRLAFMLGMVSFRPAETDEWSPAEPNWPVTSGDRVWTDADSRAEVDAGAVVLRVGPQSEIDVVQLDDRTVQVRLPQGALTERVVYGEYDENGEEHEIDAPNAAVSMHRPGVYRVDVSPDGMTTTVTVWGGEATVSEAGSSFVVNARQTATVMGSGDAPTFRLADAVPPDAFDRWGMERDAERDRLAAGPQYVPVGMPGAGDLGAYGRWEIDPALGPVWYPTTVAPGWAPYRTGHWAYVHPWGWTWVDTAPWGYAPYHYGRWAYRNGAWGWCPGRATGGAPAYAPALVQFVNAPAPNAPTVAWVPLGPGEAYQPANGVSPEYRARFNPEGPAIVGYRNQGVPSGVTVVQQQAFANQQRVEQHLVATSVKVTGVITGAPSVQPVRILPVSRAVLPPPAIIARPVVAVHQPPAERHDLVIIHPDVRAATPARTAITPVSVQTPPKPTPQPVAAKPMVPVQAPPKPAAEPVAAKPIVAVQAPPKPAAEPVAAKPMVAVQAPPKPATEPVAARPVEPKPVEPKPAEEAKPAATEPAVAPARLTPMQSSRVWRAGQVSPALEADYERKKSELDQRHRSEIEHPKEGESATERDARHEQDKRDLDAAFEKAKTAGATAIPNGAP